METLRRFSQYFRTPLVLCGTVHTLTFPQPPGSHLDDVPSSFYKLFGRPLGYVSNFKNILRPDTFMIESALDALTVKHGRDSVVEESAVEVTKRNIFHMIGLPTVSSHTLTDNIEPLLDAGKALVPRILDYNDDSSSPCVFGEHGFHLTGSANGDGFTCNVYRKQTAGAIPVYIITGILDMSTEMFHALACDIEFRKEWDDQFHHASARLIDSNISLVNWIVKWPWPLAPREYTYIMTPRILDDGTRLVMATSVVGASSSVATKLKAVAVREYFGITAARPVSDSKCRYCLYYFDDPHLPGKMPDWLEQHVTKQLLPSFPRKMLQGAIKYPPDRLSIYSALNS